MPTIIPSHETVNDARDGLLAEIRDWLTGVVTRHRGKPWEGVHDEGTFLTSFREYHLLSPDQTVSDLSRDRFYASATWWTKHGPAGYHRYQEVHHGTEHFIIFLAWLKELGFTEIDPALRAAANHIVIKGKKRRAWYDVTENRFSSMYLGTKITGKDGMNIVEHLRLVRMAWLGLAGGGDPLLKSFIHEYSSAWAEAVVSEPEVPVYLDATGDDGMKRRKSFLKALNTFIGAAPKNLTPEARIEMHVANGTPSLFLELYRETRKEVYLDAAQRLVLPLESQLWSPYANPAGDLIRALARAGRTGSIKPRVAGIMEGMELAGGCTLSMEQVAWKDPAYSSFTNTVGMRRDMPAISITRQDESPASFPCPATLVLAHQLLGDETSMINALSIATAVLAEAKSRYNDGHHHGCGSKTISAACIGHGRNWGAGHVSTALRGLIEDAARQGGISLPQGVL